MWRHQQGCGAAQGDQGCDYCIGRRQVRQLPGAAAKAATGVLAPLQELHDILCRHLPRHGAWRRSQDYVTTYHADLKKYGGISRVFRCRVQHGQ